MVRLLGASFAAAYMLVANDVSAEAGPSRWEYVLGTDFSYVSTSGHPSWAEGSAGKLRYDDRTNGFTVTRAFGDYKLRLADTLDARVVGEAYNDGIGSGLDLTQAYVEWRPLTLSPNRYRLKVGAFYPRISLENTGPAWSSPYTISSSAINTWLAEEVRIFGAEFSVSRRPQVFGALHTFTLSGAAFWNNDPTGALVSWKGWSLHDRQTRFDDILPLPPLPQIRPDGRFWRQDPFLVPFMEIDDTAGFYFNGEWQLGNRFLLRAGMYDNMADPMGLEDRQYAWYTEFNHVGVQATLPGDIGLIAQWMSGETVMGPERNGAHVVDVEFASHFLLLTKTAGRHRFTARFDQFDVGENDRFPLDDNTEHGHAWTMSYRFDLREHVGLAAEWLEVQTTRPAWAYNELDTDKSERQVQLSMQLRFGNR